MSYVLFTPAEAPLDADARKQRHRLRHTLDAMTGKRVSVHAFGQSANGPFVHTIAATPDAKTVATALRIALAKAGSDATAIAIERL